MRKWLMNNKHHLLRECFWLVAYLGISIALFYFLVFKYGNGSNIDIQFHDYFLVVGRSEWILSIFLLLGSIATILRYYLRKAVYNSIISIVVGFMLSGLTIANALFWLVGLKRFSEFVKSDNMVQGNSIVDGVLGMVTIQLLLIGLSLLLSIQMGIASYRLRIQRQNHMVKN